MPGGALSGGQQQRLCIARALAVSPDVLLMDEPCSALDPTSTRRIEETIAELANQVTIVIVTHNMQQAQRVSRQLRVFPGQRGHPGPHRRVGRPPSRSSTTQPIRAPPTTSTAVSADQGQVTPVKRDPVGLVRPPCSGLGLSSGATASPRGGDASWRKITVTVDGVTYIDDVEPRLLLVHYLRETVGKTGTPIGCDTSNCGACTVSLNGVSVKSCSVLAVQADGARDHHDRGPGERRVAPVAAGVPRRARAAVRVLHARA